MSDRIVVRRADARDLQRLGELGASLLRIHVAFDDRRFMSPGDRPEEGYARFLGERIAEPSALVLVAERTRSEGASDLVGYVYAGVEPASFKEFRERAGYIHDLLVTDEARGAGVGSRLLEAGLAWLREQGVPRVLLWAASKNPGARALFERHGFDATMIEMTREFD